MPFVFFEPPLAFFLFLDEPPPPGLDAVPESPPLLLFEGAFPPAVEVGVAAWEGVFMADEGPGESYKQL